MCLIANGSGISCCTPEGKHLSRDFLHPHCFTLDILPDDEFYRPFRVECVNFVRSMVAPRSDCTFGYAEQLNQVFKRWTFYIFVLLMFIFSFIRLHTGMMDQLFTDRLKLNQTSFEKERVGVWRHFPIRIANYFLLTGTTRTASVSVKDCVASFLVGNSNIFVCE